MAALVHLDVGIAALNRIESSCHVARSAEAHVPVVEVVRGANEYGSVLLRDSSLGPVDIGGHALVIAHGNHQLAFDSGYRLELRFGGVALFDQLGIRRGPGLRESGGYRNNTEQQSEERRSSHRD